MKSDGKKARIQTIIKILQKNNGASIRELALELGMTEMTIRRDIRILEDNEIVKVYHGSVVINPEKSTPSGEPFYNICISGNIMGDEKDAIGRAAASMVEDGDIIFIDSGSTTENMVKHLKPGLNISVVCFSLNILEEVQKRKVQKVIFGGGYYHQETKSFECDEMLSFFRNMRVNKAFISTVGVSADLGFTCVKEYEEKIKRTFMHNAGKRIILVDSSKFDSIKPRYFGSIEDADVIITDSKITPAWKRNIESRNVDIVIGKNS